MDLLFFFGVHYWHVCTKWGWGVAALCCPVASYASTPGHAETNGLQAFQDCSHCSGMSTSGSDGVILVSRKTGGKLVDVPGLARWVVAQLYKTLVTAL
jgi:hypothetical protein